MVGVLLEFYYGRFTEMVFKGKVFFILYLYSISSLYLSLFLLSLSLSMFLSLFPFSLSIFLFLAIFHLLLFFQCMAINYVCFGQ